MKRAEIAIWSAGSLQHEVCLFLDRIACAPDVERIAVMPDVHLAGDACVGTAIATRHTLYPELLGSDLGCGVAAMALGVNADSLHDSRVVRRVFDDLVRAVPTHRGAKRTIEGELARPFSIETLERVRSREGAVQLGTIGRGNHFVELQGDEADGSLWLMVHTGSRALGPAIQQAHIERATRDAMDFASFDAESAEGIAYLGDVEIALAYARHNRRIIVERIAEVAATHLKASPDSSSWIDCHHDAIAREAYDGESFYVHRKGAIPAYDGEMILIPGSMGTRSYHAEGRGHTPALRSSAHGAGRSLTRVEARRRVSRRSFAQQMKGVAFDARRMEQFVEEAPSAYKDIRRVMRAQRELVRITRTLRPLLVHKGT